MYSFIRMLNAKNESFRNKFSILQNQDITEVWKLPKKAHKHQNGLKKSNIFNKHSVRNSITEFFLLFISIINVAAYSRVPNKQGDVFFGNFGQFLKSKIEIK